MTEARAAYAAAMVDPHRCRVHGCGDRIRYEPIPTDPLAETVMFSERVCRVHAAMILAATGRTVEAMSMDIKLRPRRLLPVLPHDADDIVPVLFGVLT